MSVIRNDLETEIRDNIQEASGITGAIWSNTVLDRHIDRELLSLPKRGIYLQQMWQMTLDPTADYSNGISLPSGTEKVEDVQRNDGTSAIPYWTDINGTSVYAGALFLPYRCVTAFDIRGKLQKIFTLPTDGTTAMDIPDEKAEVVVWGVTLRCYRMLIGYLRGSQSWDAVTKPGDLSIPVIQAWIRDAKQHYQELIQLYLTPTLPRDISLVD